EGGKGGGDNGRMVQVEGGMEARADRRKRVFQILVCLHRLLPDVAAELALAVEAELSGNIDNPCRGGDLDHVGVAGRVCQRLRIDESDLAHVFSSRLSLMPFLCEGSIREIVRDILGDR